MPSRLTRQQLCDRVWTTPVHTLAKELGVSDAGIAKLCAPYDIPVPSHGYWARKAAGTPRPRSTTRERNARTSSHRTRSSSPRSRPSGFGPRSPRWQPQLGGYRADGCRLNRCKCNPFAQPLPVVLNTFGDMRVLSSDVPRVLELDFPK